MFLVPLKLSSSFQPALLHAFSLSREAMCLAKASGVSHVECHLRSGIRSLSSAALPMIWVMLRRLPNTFFQFVVHPLPDHTFFNRALLPTSSQKLRTVECGTR